MADGRTISYDISTPWSLFYTNTADPGGPAQHYNSWRLQGTGTLNDGGWDVTWTWSFGMYITGNGSGSSYYSAGQHMSTSSLDSGLDSSQDYEWAYGFWFYENGVMVSSPPWVAAPHDYGEGAEGWGSATYNTRYTAGGSYELVAEVSIIDSPNHQHLARSVRSALYVEIPDPDYRPGQILKYDGVWYSHNRTGGATNLLIPGGLTEMRTQAGHEASDNPPLIYVPASGWQNQNKIGVE